MAIQDFTAGQVLTAAQMDELQANDYNQTVSNKIASYTLVAADKGTRVVMSNASATTITVNSGLFAAGDTLVLQNIGAGNTTVTAGTCTVSTASSLVLVQYQSGTLYFTTNSSAIFFPQMVASMSAQIAIFNETQSASTNGGAITAATWTKRTLNTTQVNTLSGCSIASSVITLGAGTYLISAQTPGDQLDNFKGRLQNTSDSTTTLFSQNAYTISSAGYATVNALIMGTFTITAAKNFELQMYSQVTSGATGLGRGVAAYTSLFSQIQIQRLA